MRTGDICQAMLKFSQQFKEIKLITSLGLEHFADGLPFAYMLLSSDTIGLSLDELEIGAAKWISKVSNLKKILSKIYSFLDLVNQKTDRIKDIDVVQIAKHANPDHIARFFEVVVSVLMNSSHKDKYIQLIMTLDEQSQNTFVEIIQNSLDQQIFKTEDSNSFAQLEQQVVDLRTENAQIKNQLSDLIRKNKSLQRDVRDLREKIESYEQQQQQMKSLDMSTKQQGLHSQIEQQKVLIDNLKMKLISTVRQNEFELAQLREEVATLRIKTKNLQQVESSLQQYKQLYHNSNNEMQKISELEKEKRKLLRTIQDKELIIKRLQQKIQQNIQKNYSMQENQIYMKLQLEKRQARFKQLEKEVKIRLKSEPSQPQLRVESDPRQQQKDQINYLQEELNKTKSSLKQLQKESIKNRKRIQRLNQMQAEKKKLQKIILQINRSKDNQIQMLVISLYELRNQNIRMFQLLKKAEIKVEKA